ncbi:SIR2 family protein [Spongiactinospora sp. TRM90649]|uniref:SIR2 family NAD-dependent protein deacylase n=1 Tax=Spongiactinospora sp. TRM90649 TaxID=3031114 RepID=UPI0023F8C513|nr:SIR2 family protein [Spongiactinospora sp. TRM90649]MDF5755742.1 SIR2 family protein [Spongiactinospora sp. TRM90649]
MDDADWTRLTHQALHGDLVPFLGAGVNAGVLPTGGDLSEVWARRFAYPFADRRNLPRVLEYAETVTGDPTYVKELIRRDLSAHGPPDFTDPGNPYAPLAALPCKLFVTTNYDDFMARALRHAGKDPAGEICRWYEGDDPGEPDRPKPTAEHPLVFHLHGSFDSPHSMVLSEDDYLRFVVAMADAERPLIPVDVLGELLSKPLLFLGYSIQDWTFRSLFSSLFNSVPGTRRRRHTVVMLMPELDVTSPAAAARARDYLSRYLGGWSVALYVGTAADFLRELGRRMSEVS